MPLLHMEKIQINTSMMVVIFARKFYVIIFDDADQFPLLQTCILLKLGHCVCDIVVLFHIL